MDDKTVEAGGSNVKDQKWVLEFYLSGLLRMLAFQSVLIKKGLLTQREVETQLALLNDHPAMKELRSSLGVQGQFFENLLQAFEGPCQ